MWNDEIEKDFEELKKAFTEGGIQAFPDFWMGNLFWIGARRTSLEYCHQEVQEGQEQFLGCWGRKCNKYERNYLSYKGELLTVIQCIKKWKHILSYRLFEVHMDASTLKYQSTMKNQSGLFKRWCQELAGFNFIVEPPWKDRKGFLFNRQIRQAR